MQTDRRFGVIGETGIKMPVRAATTGNITLIGEQTVDGIALVEGDRCLVKDQTDSTENGIYLVDTADWQRAADFDGPYDCVSGTLVLVTSGTLNDSLCFKLSTADPITIGTSSLTFASQTVPNLISLAASSGSSLVGFIDSGVGAVARTEENKLRALGVSLSDYCTGTGDEAVQIQKAVTAASGRVLEIDIAVSTTATINGISDITIRGAGGSIKNTDPSAATDISILKFDGKSNFVIDGVHLIGSAKNVFHTDGTCSGIQTVDCTDFAIINNLIEDQTMNGIYVEASDSGTTMQGVITGNRLYDNGAVAINPGTGTHTGGDVSINVAGTGIAKRFVIANNLCEGAGGIGIGLAPEAASTGSIFGVSITGNHVQGKGQHGIMLYPEHTVSDSEYAPVDISITGNTVANCNWMGIYGIGKIRNVTVTGNNVTNCCLKPGSLTPGSPATPTLAWGNISLNGSGTLGRATGCVISGNTVDDFNGYSGIYSVNSDHFSITNNVIMGDATAAVAFNSNGITAQDNTYTDISGNKVLLLGAGGNGIYIDGEASGGGGGGGVNPLWAGNSITNNTIVGASLNGISARVQKQYKIIGNTILTPLNYGIWNQDGADGLIADNMLIDGTAGYADIFLSVTSAGDTLTNTQVSRNVMKGTKATGQGIRINSAAVSDPVFEDNDYSGLTSTSFANKFLVSAWTRGQFLRQKYGLETLHGIFTFAAGTTVVVSNVNTPTAAYRIMLFPYNAAAATLVSGANSPYVSAVTAGTSFTVATAGGGSSAGTETFGYLIM